MRKLRNATDVLMRIVVPAVFYIVLFYGLFWGFMSLIFVVHDHELRYNTEEYLAGFNDLNSAMLFGFTLVQTGYILVSFTVIRTYQTRFIELGGSLALRRRSVASED